MPKRSPSHRPVRRKQRTAIPERGSGEDGAADALTIAWTVSVTMVVVTNLVTVAAYFYASRHPDSKAAPAFGAIMLLTACFLGSVSLIMLPITWHIRRVKPPLGYTVFAALVAAAPVIATIARLMK